MTDTLPRWTGLCILKILRAMPEGMYYFTLYPW